MSALDYYDISPVISPQLAVFPGDQPFERQLSLSFERGDGLELSYIKSSVHVGAHVDAPSHYSPKGESIEARRLDYYLGPVQVVSWPKGQLLPGERIGLSHWGKRAVLAPRILFRTDSFPDPNQWRSDFNSLSGDLIAWLSHKGVCLVGIDTPSIDPADEKILSAHAEIACHNMAILEGIVLQEVPDGLYQLIALPLSLQQADASPVRAILLKHPLNFY